MTKKILILYASYGDGHIQVSRALKEQIERSEGTEAVLVDLFAEAYPMLNAFTKLLYIKSYTMFPKLYGWTYYRTRHMPNDTLFSSWFNGWGMSKLKQVIKEHRPDAVVNTFPMMVMPELRKKTGVGIPIYNVITDFVLHCRWIHPQVDKYYVATDDLKKEIINAGIPADKVRTTGIPLKKEFQITERTTELFEKYKLDPAKRTVLIMAGSYGVLSGLKEVCQSVASLPGMQLLVVCGKNKQLHDSMQECFAGHPSIRVFSFVTEMNELMAVSDTIVTKPGGITLTESIQSELPIVLFRPVPGQERDNAEYLSSKGAAFIANDFHELTRQIRELLEDERKLSEARERISLLRMRHSAETIVQDMLADMSSRRFDQRATPEIRRVSSERIS
ncbi:MGDG synthase family glycosyltransferase [Paenibacillus thermotolerans]|uniref:MGDG synthase family glycosyltransferase n=1 Tax=Paenibacillus thermotolerans TaxID=3027807 RepID=UPI0023689DD5|nr:MULTISPECIES: glycosyltransferase [unclassified Paenibacillus]